MQHRITQILVLFSISLCTMYEVKAQGSYSLFFALEKNDKATLRSLLDKGADTNAVDGDSDNVLMYAALYASAECMELLLKGGANSNAKNKAGETPLMWCAHDSGKVQLLLQYGADINAKAKSGNTPLLIASAGNGQYPVLKMLLDKGADPLAKNGKQETALIRASLFGDTMSLSLLINKGINVNAQDDGGRTALMGAIISSNRQAVVKLMDSGANPDIANNQGWTALSVSTIDDIEIVKAILVKAKSINTPDPDGYTPLMWAAYNEHDNIQVIRTLLNKGADVNAKSKNGATALSFAIKKGNTATVALLRKAGAQ